MSNRLLLNLFFFFVFSSLSQAQSPADWWYFGFGAGVHFTGSGVVADTNGQIFTTEGCASISDAAGNLLFYTDGSTVYDRQHQVMPNGTGLHGHSSSSQSAIIVPDPGSEQGYYVVTVSVYADTGLRYSLVDMSLNGGLGDVVTSQKNVLMIRRTGENVCAVRNATNDGIWIVSHVLYGDTVVAFEITSGGVNGTPVVSHTGDSLNARVGCLKGSPDAQWICFGSQHFENSQNTGRITLMDFNNLTGQLDDVIHWKSPVATSPYGVDFSPNSQVLYISDGWSSTNRAVLQYDISTFDSTAIVSSEFVVSDSISFGQLQLAPDDRIYISTRLWAAYFPAADSFLHRINDPNTLGAGCDLELYAVYLEGRRARMGLPPFLSSFFNADFTFSGLCEGDTTYFTMDTADIGSVSWNFGDPASGSANTSTLFFPSHVFTDTGWFTVTLIANKDTLVDTTVREIYIYALPQLDLGPDTHICRTDTVTYIVSQPYTTFLWNDGSTEDTIEVFSDTTISVTAFGVCDTLSDTVTVTVQDTLEFDLGPDTLVCGNAAFELDPGLSGAIDFAWSTGDSAQTIMPVISDVYTLSATNACGTIVDSVKVKIRPVPPDSLLPGDTINCFDNEIVLVRPDLDSITYVWSDSSTKKTYTVDTTETVWLAAFNECGFSIDTINIIFNGEILSELGEDTAICEGDSIALVATHPGATYMWNTGEVSDTIWSDQLETFNYVVTITFKDCQTIESKRVDMDDFYCPPIDCSLQYANIFSPNGDGINDLFRPWSDCEIYSFSMYIYNRWGLLVHSDNHVNIGWDGFIHGDPAPEGVYYFVIDFLDRVVVDEDRNVYQGSFTLLR